jgi:hypothetical protein
MADELESKRIPYHRYAFSNPYNLSILGGLGALAVLTGAPYLLVFGAAAEALWMLFAPDSKSLQRLWFDRVHAEKLREQQERAMAEKLSGLPLKESERVARLGEKREQILRLARDNRELTSELMRGELDKLSTLLSSFTELIVSANRYETYLGSVSIRELEADLRKQEGLVKSAGEPENRALAQKNLDVLMRRRDKLAELRAFVSRARAQMELIENSFELLSDQIITMRSPRELGGQLDELLDGVEAVQTTARETEALLEGVSR